MNINDLVEICKKHPNIEINIGEDAVLVRDENLPWYSENPNNHTRIEKWALKDMDEKTFLEAVQQGLQVEWMTRVTGYFSKVRSWNDGKRQELRDRKKWSV